MIFLGMLAAIIYFRSIIFQPGVNQYLDTIVVFAEEQFDVDIPSHINVSDEIQVVVENECEPPEIDLLSQKKDIEAVDVIVETETKGVINDLHATDTVTESNDELVLIETLSEVVNSINEKVDMLFEINKAATVDPVLANNLSSSNEKIADLNEETPVAQISNNSIIDAKQTLIMARRSFWNGHTRESENIYLDLASNDNNDPDIYGELGNVYYTQGKWKQAGKAYYEAAVRLLAQNNNKQVSNRVNYLLRVIQGLDKESAKKLSDMISG